jgi:N-acetylneuraminic acid mutarotase
MWAYDPAANSWTELKPSGDVPVGRSFSCFVYNHAVGKAILFGGANGSTAHDATTVLGGSTALNDTWAYDPAANTWTKLHPCDPPFDEETSALDTEGGRAPIEYELKGIIGRMLRQQALAR